MVSGTIVEIYEYEKPVLSGYHTERPGRSNTADEEEKKQNRALTMQRASREVRRLINTNMSSISKFITLTFKENVQDIDYANNEFKKFIKRLNRYIGVKVSYVAVVEYQKRGAIHYHCVMFNVPYIANSALKDLWGNGFVRINQITQVDNLGAYVSKYMTKDNDDERLVGKKCYFSSRGLAKPMVINEDDQVQKLAASLPGQNMVYEKTFENDVNTTHYKQYNLKRRV